MSGPKFFVAGHGHGHSHTHSHSGSHTHGHAHSHSHEHEHGAANGLGDAEGHRQALERGAGAGKVLFLDAFSGVAGDMTIAALVDLGVPFRVVEESVSELGLSGFALELKQARGGVIGGTKFDVRLEDAQPDRRYRAIDDLLAASRLAPGVKSLARRIFLRLAEAEANVHRSTLDSVAFHEVGAVDAIVDIVGAAACFEFLGAEVVSSALPMGRGSVVCQHGVLPLPAPATVACLSGVPTVDAGIEAELVTPTGAAIVASVAHRFQAWPGFAPERIGWGFGSRVLPDRLNALRVILGSAAPQVEPVQSATHVVLEANIDDMTGELAAHALQRLLDSGALDAWATPIVMKKGRPALTLSLICERAAEQRLAEALLRETHSIGVRHTPVSRTERPRRFVEVSTEFGVIPLKISEGPYGPPRIKPEFEACAAAAQAAGVPVGSVIAAALAAYQR
ncbi:MAG TPA: nickel pincer cofactor biosynthesis protein LarC [Polyangiaceae bacterium]|nr:nickel pincer cofactor biosynthesis protein LarC [Polyangiaceae bacterium]